MSNRGMLDRLRGSVGLSQSNLQNENTRSNTMSWNPYGYQGTTGGNPQSTPSKAPVQQMSNNPQSPYQQQPTSNALPQPPQNFNKPYQDPMGDYRGVPIGTPPVANGPMGNPEGFQNYGGVPQGPVMPQFNGGNPAGMPNMANQWRPTPRQFNWRNMRSQLTPQQGLSNAFAERGDNLVGFGESYNFGNPQPVQLPPPNVGGGNNTDPYGKG